MKERLREWLVRVKEYELPFETRKWSPPNPDAFIADRQEGAHVEELRQLGYVE